VQDVAGSRATKQCRRRFSVGRFRGRAPPAVAGPCYRCTAGYLPRGANKPMRTNQSSRAAGLSPGAPTAPAARNTLPAGLLQSAPGRQRSVSIPHPQGDNKRNWPQPINVGLRLKNRRRPTAGLNMRCRYAGVYESPALPQSSPAMVSPVARERLVGDELRHRASPPADVCICGGSCCITSDRRRKHPRTQGFGCETYAGNGLRASGELVQDWVWVHMIWS